MSPTPLVALVIYGLLGDRTPRNLVRLQSDLRVGAFVILSEHSTSLGAELVCRADHPIQALLECAFVLGRRQVLSPSFVAVCSVRSGRQQIVTPVSIVQVLELRD